MNSKQVYSTIAGVSYVFRILEGVTLFALFNFPTRLCAFQNEQAIALKLTQKMIIFGYEIVIVSKTNQERESREEIKSNAKGTRLAPKKQFNRTQTVGIPLSMRLVPVQLDACKHSQMVTSQSIPE